MIEKILIISFIVFAIWYTMQEDEIFGGIRSITYKWPEWIKTPLYDCPVCMCFWYGSILYWIIFVDWDWVKINYGTGWLKVPIDGSIKEWLIVVIAAMGLNAILNKMFPPDEIELKDNE